MIARQRDGGKKRKKKKARKNKKKKKKTAEKKQKYKVEMFDFFFSVYTSFIFPLSKL